MTLGLRPFAVSSSATQLTELQPIRNENVHLVAAHQPRVEAGLTSIIVALKVKGHTISEGILYQKNSIKDSFL